MAPIIKLTAKQVGAVYLDRMVGFFQKGIKPEEALAQTLQSIGQEVAERRELAQEALTEMMKYRHPQTGAGILKDKAERLARYNAEGAKDAAELVQLQGVADPSDPQKARILALHGELTKDSENVNALKASIATDEANYARWKQRYDERFAKLKESQDAFQQLQDEGPALIAQIKDSQRAAAEEARDAANANKPSGAATAASVLTNLRGEADQAGRHEDAGNLLDAALKGEPSLDDQIAAHAATQANDDTVSAWLNAAKG